MQLTCIIVIMISTVFSSKVLDTQLLKTKIDIYGMITLIGFFEILGYILGLSLFKWSDISN